MVLEVEGAKIVNDDGTKNAVSTKIGTVMRVRPYNHFFVRFRGYFFGSCFVSVRDASTMKNASVSCRGGCAGAVRTLRRSS